MPHLARPHTPIALEDLLRTARSFVGVRYQHLGRDRFGLDCLGLWLATIWELGAAYEDFLDYSCDPSTYILVEQLGLHMQQLGDWRREVRVGDLLVCRFHSSLPPQHIVIVTKLEGLYVWGIHASRKHGVVEQRVAHLERVALGFRLREVT